MKDLLDKKHILIINPEHEIEQALTLAFPEINGSKIFAFTSGRSALSQLDHIRPHCILSTFLTEDITGKDVFLALVKERTFKAHRHIPMGLTSEEKERNQYGKMLFDLGLRFWLITPLNPHVLREILINLFFTEEVYQQSSTLQQEVKKSEYRFRDLLENANDVVFILDEKGNFVYLNNRFQSLTGFEKEMWIEKRWADLVDVADHELALEALEMVHHGRARIFEAKIQTKQGDPIFLSISLTPIVEKDAVIGVIGIGRDITEQKRMEKEIVELKNFNESIIESMEAGLLTIDLEGRVTSLNRGGQNILGVKIDEVLGKPITSVLQPSEVEELLSNKSNNLFRKREMQLTLKSGKKISIGFTVTDRLDNQRNKVGTIVSFRDITEIKQMEAQLIRMDRLASLGVLASGIAHEIRNPLAGIKTLAQACDEELEETDSRKEYLARIIRQINRLDELLRTFFAFAKPKPPDMKPHHLNDILREVYNLISKRLELTKIQYIQNVESNLPSVYVDNQQMQQVFLNLILNAIDAMPSGGTLTISARKVLSPTPGMIRKLTQVQGSPLNSFVEVSVADTGIGIPLDKLETIFDPFFTTKPNGLGLGLSIVYRIIETHCGDIWVKSYPGQGTEFYILLPTGAEK